MNHRGGRLHRQGPGGPARDQVRRLGATTGDQRICRDFQNGSCRFGRACKFSHNLSSKNNVQQLAGLQEPPEQQQARADYQSWKRLIKTPPPLNIDRIAEQIWNGALTILDGEEQERKQMVPRDLEDDQNCRGREHIKALLALRSKPGAYGAYIEVVRPFLMVITHTSVLDCLSIDTSVGALYNFIGGTNGTRAIPFFIHVCEMLIKMCDDTPHSTVSVSMDTTLVATSTALRELLRRETRVRFNEDLLALFQSMEKATEAVGMRAEPRSKTTVLNHLGEVKAIVARARGLLAHEEDHQNIHEAGLLTSSYPNGFQAPQDRHDNDKKDITKIKIFPTREEIWNGDVVFLPSTDLDQPHFLADPAERHLDTHFRLLRYDIFGELKEVVGSLMHAVEKNAINPGLNTGNFRANHYSEAHISYIEFESRRGLELHLTFNQPAIIRKKSDAEKCKWWEESRRLTEGVLLSFTSLHAEKVQQIFLVTTRKCTSLLKDNSLVKSSRRATITVKLATYDQANVECAIRLSCGKARGLLTEFPGILPATFSPILVNLQDIQQNTRLPFSQWIIPDKINGILQNPKVDIPPPLYATKVGFKFSLELLLRSDQSHKDPIQIDPVSLADDSKTLDEMEARTTLDRGQCRALIAALTRQFALIQGPPGTGKTYLGIQLVRVLIHHKKTADLGPIIIVCYTNHALDQFLEHLILGGIKNIIRIGGSSKSSLLDDHNLRKVSETQRKSKLEKFFLFTHFKSLEDEGKRIKDDLGKLHGLSKQGTWSNLKRYLAQSHRRIYEQFHRLDEDGFETVGRHPYDLWASGDALTTNVVGMHENNPIGINLNDVLRRAEINVNELSQAERRTLTEHWIQQAYEQILDDLSENLKETENIRQMIANIHDETDRRVLQGADIIGMTTTGLAKRISVLKHVRSKIVICEEAGEVMESHILSAMLPSVEHFIQIGDHEQLRPQINDFINLSLESKQGVLYQLDRSQFERLSVGVPGRPRIPIAQLNIQRRMRPEISTLIRKTVYPMLADHASVINLPDVVGMRKNVFWLNHSHYEEDQHPETQGQRSHSNIWEVEMVHGLVRHIIRQGVYSSSEIAVLTPYTGQLQQLRSIMRNDFEIVLSDRDQDALEKDGFVIEEDDPELTRSRAQRHHQTRKVSLEKKNLSDLLRIATVDNFQGEEAKVIIVSLVRSNHGRKVGFLRTTNRVNVLLSRAQHGMYLIGNADTYSNIPMWQKVINMLRASDSINTWLELCCPRHSEDAIQISVPEDFSRLSPEGGCRLACSWRLPECGHMCQSRCHSKSMHDVFLCPQPCARLHDPCGHQCQKKTCGEDCGNCVVRLENIRLPCGHVKDNVLCHLAQDPNAIKCDTPVLKKVPKCNHLVEVQCSVDTSSDQFQCSKPCESLLACGHICHGTCAGCTSNGAVGKRHKECQKTCEKPRSSCNHICGLRCHDGKDCGPCFSRCEVRCRHSQCMLRCHQPCAPCVERCTWSCEHQGSCSMPCSAPCNRLPCNERCSKDLPCGHRCPGLCGEICPKEHCHLCSEKQDARVDLLEMKTYAEIDVDETPIVLLGCGHIFTAETLDGMIGLQDVYTTDSSGLFIDLTDISGTMAPKIPRCPDCQRPVRQYVTQRYNRVINRAVIDEMSKRFLIDGQTDLQELENQVQAFEEELDKSRSSLAPDANIAKHKKSRQSSSSRLMAKTQNFLRNVANRHQPAQKLFDAQVLAVASADRAKASENPFLLDLQTSNQSKLDQRIVFGGLLIQIKAECIVLEDIMITAVTASSAEAPVSLKALKKFFKSCETFINDCKRASLPKLFVEASLCFARIALLCQSSKRADISDDKASRYVDTAKILLNEAIKLCNQKFQHAQQLEKAAEKSLKLLHASRYETVKPEELNLIKQAMVKGRDGIATHSGHWYQCINNHPFAIGECGMPMEHARCPECGAPIGGSNHQAVEGVTRATQMED